MADLIEPIGEFIASLAARDTERAVKLYAEEAVVVRYEGVAAGRDQIRAFLVGWLSTYERFDLVSVDQVQHNGDMVLWDSSHETGAGVLLTTNVVQLDGDGHIARHVPLVRGYWGKP